MTTTGRKPIPPTPPPSPAPPATPAAPGPVRPGAAARRGALSFGAVRKRSSARVVIYGTGGIGKTTLAAMAPGPVAFIDLDDSLPTMADQLDQLDLRLVQGIASWQQFRDAISAPGWDEIRTLVIDTGTRAEELCIAHTLATVPHSKGFKVTRIEDYGYGKGYTHVFENFLPLLTDLDAHVHAGRNVVLICHECTSNVPNPQGEDYLRYEPRLVLTRSVSIRHRVKEWADHLLFVGYDIDAKDGKARGSGTRTIWPCEMPHCMAKSRTLSEPVPYYQFDAALWKALFNQA